MLRKLVFTVVVAIAALFIMGALSNGGINVKYTKPIEYVSKNAVKDVSTGARVVLQKTSDGAKELSERF